MANAFNMLRSNDLIWPYVINNYLQGKAPMPFDLLYWNSDATRMPAANHSFYLRKCYLDNTLSKGKMDDRRRQARSREGEGADLQSRHPRGPHRAGEIGRSSARSSSAGRCKFVLSGSGHIAGVVNPPGKTQVPVLDRRQAGRRQARSLAEEGEGAPRLVVAGLVRWIKAQMRRSAARASPAAASSSRSRTRRGSYVKVRDLEERRAPPAPVVLRCVSLSPHCAGSP